VLRDLGFDEAHIADSRSAAFETAVRAATHGRGVDVVLNSLTGDLVDASLRLLADGGRFLEMGCTDIRSADDIARRYPGVRYRAFDLGEAGPERGGTILVELLALLDAGVLRPLPSTEWDVRRIGEAMRTMVRGRHIGKNVISVPRRLDRAGTVLITGGTGTLGALIARHVVAEHGIRSVLLASRSGGSAAGADELAADLREHGARVDIVGCDVSDRRQVAELIARVPADAPLTAVVHAAAVLDDGVVEALTPERIDRVFGPKLDAAVHLDELTGNLDLAAFVLFSSGAGVIGNAGQAGYAAANAYLDALAARRRAAAQPAVSLAWGYWAATSVLTGQTEIARRMDRDGILPLASEVGMSLFDHGLLSTRPVLLPVALDHRVLREQARDGSLPSLLRDLVGPVRPAAATRQDQTPSRLAGLSGPERLAALTELVREHTAAVLGTTGPPVHETRAFRDLGLDSLTAVELRNRLAKATALSLPATVAFDYPDAKALGERLHELSGGGPADTPQAVDEPRLRALLADLPLERFRAVGLLDGLIELAVAQEATAVSTDAGSTDGLDDLDESELVGLLRDTLTDAPGGEGMS
jgi:polyketide synthase 12